MVTHLSFGGYPAETLSFPGVTFARIPSGTRESGTYPMEHNNGEFLTSNPTFAC